MAHYQPQFPAEGIPVIWLNVFKKLDKADKPSFSRTFDQWHDWVAPEVTTFLSVEAASPLVETLPKKALLQSRELCQSWKQELDHQAQIHPMFHRFDFEFGTNDIRNIKPENYFASAEEIQKFIKEMEAHPGNPFPRRAVSLSWSPPHDPAINEVQSAELCRAFWLRAIQLFEKFGEHIWDATFFVDDSGIIAPILMEIVRSYLLLLPHLKRVDIFGDIGSSPDVTRSFYTLNPLPQLEQLKTVDINCGSAFTESFMSSCCVAANITRLSIWPSSPTALCQQAYNFFNLEVLEAKLFIEDLEEFRNLAQIPPLREIRFSFINMEVFAPRLFNALEPFAKSLISFALNKVIVRDEDRTETRINLPNLKRLKVETWEGSLDPLIQINTLNFLEINSSSLPISQMEGHQLEFYGFEERIYESNIWNLMPSLNTLCVTVTNGYLFKKTYYRYVFNKRQLKAQNESGFVNNINSDIVDAYTQTYDDSIDMDSSDEGSVDADSDSSDEGSVDEDSDSSDDDAVDADYDSNDDDAVDADSDSNDEDAVDAGSDSNDDDAVDADTAQNESGFKYNTNLTVDAYTQTKECAGDMDTDSDDSDSG